MSETFTAEQYAQFDYQFNLRHLADEIDPMRLGQFAVAYMAGEIDSETYDLYCYDIVFGFPV